MDAGFPKAVECLKLMAGAISSGLLSTKVHVDKINTSTHGMLVMIFSKHDTESDCDMCSNMK